MYTYFCRFILFKNIPFKLVKIDFNRSLVRLVKCVLVVQGIFSYFIMKNIRTHGTQLKIILFCTKYIHTPN